MENNEISETSKKINDDIFKKIQISSQEITLINH